MKKYKLFITILTLYIGANIPSVNAQDRTDGGVSIIPVRLEQRGEFLYIDIDFVADKIKIKSAQGLDLIPRLVSTEALHTLPMVSYKGRSEYYAYERTLSLMSKKEKAAYQAPYVVEKTYKLEKDTIHYHQMIPYEPWMENAHLDIQRDDCGCGKVELMNTELLVDKVTTEAKEPAIPYVVTPHMVYIQPTLEEIKRREIQAEAFLDFAVNKTDIRPDYMNNPRELTKIRTMIDELNNDPSINVKGLDIIGYASPEGSLAHNKRLSEGRAMALRDYLSTRYEFPLNAYRIKFGGENWEGLVKALSTMEMEDKNEVLEVINKTSIEDGREAKLMKLNGGIPYRFMLKHIFPSLRVAICKVEYNVKSFDVDEAKEVIKTNPKNLSLYEMFLVANSYPRDSQEFTEVFEIAAQVFPTDETANLNAATSAIQRNDLEAAEQYLNKIDTAKDSPEYKNTAGILSLLKGNYEDAEKLLNSAAAHGLEAAKLNIEELKKVYQRN
ncbi:DUF3868 domain-containing protein [Bacteroides sp. 51]|uniref:DUF3868 domain-containing protein n=1 Tax=Bacteroides sp. 51 TaxID=2302938 RepID=UPI0013D3F5F2|nr:DUF3868 domain-containing protein [Bacteroides sp. 51]NDV82839.1 DUF3868 domain-containing protein [Bacteroides sp. 51]